MDPAFEPPTQDGVAHDGDEDVGSFEQGTEFSRWALARYIVGRVILERTSWALLAIAVILLVVAGLCEWLLHSTALAVLVMLLVLVVLAMRAVLGAVVHRLMSAAYGPLEERVRAITGGAGKGVLAELRRVGLPGRTWTLPLLITLLVGRRRVETMERIRTFDVDRAVPRAQRDELHMVLRQAAGSTGSRRP